jgi:hypothetical protein
MVEIKDVYQNFDGETIEEDIMKYYNDDLQNMLLALVKGLFGYFQLSWVP